MTETGASSAAPKFLDRKVFGLPMWGWTLTGTVLVGAGWILWRRHTAASSADEGPNSAPGSSSDTFSAYANPQQTIVPINQGLAESQTQQILDGIRGIQGPTSSPAPAGGATTPVHTIPASAGGVQGTHLTRGTTTLEKNITLFQLARRYAVHPNDADEVARWEYKIATQNAKLIGKDKNKTLRGGTKIKVT